MSRPVALITGASRGIGRGIALELAKTHSLVATYRGRQDAAETLRAETGAEIVQSDIGSAADRARLLAFTREKFGRLDLLVNNAGINTMAHRVNIDAFPAEEWDRILRVDLTGPFLVSRAAAKPMLAQGSGRIVNIASVLGLVPARLQCAYTAAKAGLVNLTRTMAIELGSKGVLTNCIAPGSILSEGTRKLFYGADGTFNDRVQAMLSHVPLGRPGRPEEIAHAVLFLAAPGSSYINGAVIPVDGGWIAGYSRDF
jgi:NAD(P)-dependent dehydrogenase (short-subunit alcohol dehydrogenase family)